MMPQSVSVRALLRAGTLAAAFAVTLPALAQQPAAPLPKPGTPGAPNQPLYGRPDNDAAMKLAPVPAPPIAAAPDKLAADKLKLPKGFNIEVYASGIPDARSMRLGDKGTVFVGNRLQDKVYAITEKDGKRTVKVIASGLYKPNGLAFHNGALYIAELSKISKIEGIEDKLDNPPKPTLVYDNLPKDEAHGWKFIAIGPDNKLYVPVGQPCNACIPSDAHGQIRRMNLDGTGVEVIARGVRNTVGFDWHPVSKELYFTDNGRDWLSEDLPNDELNRITKAGQHFGSHHQGRPAFRLALLPAGQYPGFRVRLGPFLQRVRSPRRPHGPARRRARHALLHRDHVPGGISRRDSGGTPRLVEPLEQVRRRHRGGEAQQGRQREVGRALHHRFPGRQQVYRPAGGRSADEGRLAPDLRRL
jgi:hypothetical protein